MGLGGGTGLKVSCEDWTNMPRQEIGCEQKSHNSEAIRVCRVHQKHDKVQISGSIAQPQAGLWLMHSIHFWKTPAGSWREKVTPDHSWGAREDGTKVVHPFCLPNVSEMFLSSISIIIILSSDHRPNYCNRFFSTSLPLPIIMHSSHCHQRDVFMMRETATCFL